jgi:hypothetical protein
MKIKGIEIPQFFFPEGKLCELETIEEQNVRKTLLNNL